MTINHTLTDRTIDLLPALYRRPKIRARDPISAKHKFWVYRMGWGLHGVSGATPFQGLHGYTQRLNAWVSQCFSQLSQLPSA